jgi:LDH2 family malate/lactate/ureidoglycolate dehydrogenase
MAACLVTAGGSKGSRAAAQQIRIASRKSALELDPSNPAGKYVAFKLYGDNQAALRLMRNVCVGAQNRTKHVDIAYNFSRQKVMQGEVTMQFVGTDNMVADMLTKQLPGPAFRTHRCLVGVSTVALGKE